MSKKKILAKLISNPGAGKPEGKTKCLEEVTRWLQEAGVNADVVLANPKKEATPIAKQAVKDGYSTIVAMGGDGTIEAIINGMVGSKAHLGIIPTGTANNIARSLGIPQDLQAACQLIASDHTRKLDVGIIKQKKHKRYFMELVAVGLTAALYPDTKNFPEEKIASLKNAAATLLRFEKQPKVYLTLDGESRIRMKTLLVTIANTPSFGLNFLVAPAASLSDGFLDISTYPEFTKAEVLAYFARVMNERTFENPRLQRYRAQKIKVKTRPKLEIMADGYMMGKGKAKIKILRKALRVIAPQAGEGLDIAASEGDALPAPVSPVLEALELVKIVTPDSEGKV